MRASKPQRLYQLGFDDAFELAEPQDVTPEDFAGIEFPGAEGLDLPASKASRFVREVAGEVVISTAKDAIWYLQERVYVPFDDFDQEELWVLLLNTKHRVTHEVMAYRGTVGGVYVRAAELLKAAVWFNAPAVIIAHNHPSGVPDPSPEDVRVTKQINEAAKILDIDLVDHIVVGKPRCVSMKQRNLF
ncbi:MAG: RadC family protein [Anaerolineae bacterium]